jgi:hypothetical protein
VTSAVRTPELGAQICELLEDGLPLIKIAQIVGLGEPAIRRWAREDGEFGAKYALARNIYNEVQAEEIITLADAARADDPTLVGAYRLAIDTRKWVLSKVLPKKYGDKLINEHTGPDGSALNIIIKRFTPERE